MFLRVVSRDAFNFDFNVNVNPVPPKGHPSLDPMVGQQRTATLAADHEEREKKEDPPNAFFHVLAGI